MVTIQRHEWLTSGKDNERRQQCRFQLFSATILRIKSSRSTRARIFFCPRRSAQNVFPVATPQIAFAKKTREGNIKCPSSTREDTNSQVRSVRRTSKHFPTNKVDFLTNNVVLRTICTMTVSRNATNDFRTESERLAYGSRPYMQFPVFGEGGSRAL